MFVAASKRSSPDCVSASMIDAASAPISSRAALMMLRNSNACSNVEASVRLISSKRSRRVCWSG